MNKIEKNYLQVPVNFLFMMDRHCFQLMAVLLQKYFYSKNTGKLSEDDTFLMSLTELDDVLNNANQKDTRLTIEALYRAGLIRVENYNGKRNITKFGINWKMVEDINNMIIQDLKDGDLYIQKLPRTERITYCSTNCIQNVYKLYTNCTPNINNIDNIYNINNKNNINNNLNINNNILKEKENINSITTINIKEKEISEDLVNSVNNDEYVILNNFKEDMKGNFEELVTGLLQRMESKTREELREKRVKVIQWLNNHTDCYTPTERLEIEKKLEERYTELSESFVNSVNNGCNILSSILLNGSAEPFHKKKENTTPTEKTREQLVTMMDEVITTSTGDELEISNFQMWVKLNKTALQRHNLMGKADETLQNLKKGQKEAISATFPHKVEQVPTSSVNAVKTPKIPLNSKVVSGGKNGTPYTYQLEDGKQVTVVGDVMIPTREGKEEAFDVIDEIWSEMQAAL